MDDTQFVNDVSAFCESKSDGSSTWGADWKGFAAWFCPLCAGKIPIVYYGDGSGWQGYMHRQEQTLARCKAQACQAKLHPPSSWITA